MEISLGDLFLNEHQKNQVQKIIFYLNNIEKDYNLFNIFLDFQPYHLDGCTIVQLNKLLDLKSILFELEEIHIKTIKTTEYKNIEKFYP